MMSDKDMLSQLTDLNFSSFILFITEYKQLLYYSLLLMMIENMKAGLKR